MGAEQRAYEVEVRGSSVHVVEAGSPDAPAVVFVHGWPQSSDAWSRVVDLAGSRYRALAIDLPGIGRSTGATTDGSKAALAEVVHDLALALDLRDLAIVGHDIGAMIAYSYLRAHAPRRAVLINSVVPGLDPWQSLLENPRVWHFAFHAIPQLPETLVHGHQRQYFDFFFDALSPRPSAVSPESREASVVAYRSTAALKAGFDWYRACPRDAERNAADTKPLATPVLYLRGDQDPVDIEAYLAGFRSAGLTNVRPATIAGCGHFVADEKPAETWRAIEAFLDA